MKVNFNPIVRTVKVNSIRIGQTFTAARKSTGDTGLYMKVDAKSWVGNYDSCGCYAVNLESGCLRKFACSFDVVPVDSEVYITS